MGIIQALKCFTKGIYFFPYRFNYHDGERKSHKSRPLFVYKNIIWKRFKPIIQEGCKSTPSREDFSHPFSHLQSILKEPDNACPF